MTKEEFLLDTLDYYTGGLGRRCNALGVCKYSPYTLKLQETSEGCAIGRHLDPEVALDFDAVIGITSISNIMGTSRREYLPIWMQSMPTSFLSDVQNLHDDNQNWDNGGLSHIGRSRVSTLIVRHMLIYLPDSGIHKHLPLS